jgi:hypothetical protein
MPKIKPYPFEVFKIIDIHPSLKLKYALSNKGRLISFTNDILEGNLVKGSKINGYSIFRYKVYENGKTINKHKMFSKLVAEHFLPQPIENQRFILHEDYNKTNNSSENLFWGTSKECVQHGVNSPKFIEAQRRKSLLDKPTNAKLSVAKVRIIKRMLNSENQTRQKMIAKQFGVTATQIKRIQTGENWGKVKI